MFILHKPLAVWPSSAAATLSLGQSLVQPMAYSTDVHRMTSLLRLRLPLSTDFVNAKLSARGSRAPTPMTSARSAQQKFTLLGQDESRAHGRR
jgi:hypothetical protein